MASLKYDSRWKPIQRKVGVNDDGLPGKLTLNAIAKELDVIPNWHAVQCACGTDVDGIPGPKTISAISDRLHLTIADDDEHIVIDIGHADGTGARGNGLEEHAVNVIIATHLQSMLHAKGYSVTVIDFPEQSNRDDLNSSIRRLNEISYDCAISLHSDASDNTTARGGHVIYRQNDQQSFILAAHIAEPLSELLPGRSNVIVARNNLGILNQAKRSPIVLCEGGFITNEHDAGIMKDRPEDIARAYFTGIHSYMSELY